jgi:hypothetical protein
LAGERWPIPHLTLGKNRRLQPLFAKAAAHILAPDTKMADLTGDDFDTLVEITYVALTQAHPTLTREEFEELPIGMVEMVAAIGTIMEQSKLYRAPKAGETAPGEA